MERTSGDSTHDSDERRENNGNGELLKGQHDSRRKDELIMNSGILIDINKICDEMKGKINGKILHQRKKKTSTQLSDGVTVRQ